MSFEIWLKETEDGIERAEYAKALSAIDKISNIHPRSRWVSLKRGQILFYMGKLEAAQNNFKNAKVTSQLLGYVESLSQGSKTRKPRKLKDPKFEELFEIENQKLLDDLKPALVSSKPEEYDYRKAFAILGVSLGLYLMLLIDLFAFTLAEWTFGVNTSTTDFDYEPITLRSSLFFTQRSGFGFEDDCFELNFRSIFSLLVFYIVVPLTFTMSSTKTIYVTNMTSENMDPKLAKKYLWATIGFTLLTILAMNLVTTLIELKLFDSLDLLTEDKRSLILGNYLTKNFIFAVFYLISFIRFWYPDLKFLVYPVLGIIFFIIFAVLLIQSESSICDAETLSPYYPR